METSFNCILKACLIFCLAAWILTVSTPVQAASQNECWCCIDGKVMQISAEECKKKGGRCYPTKEEAEKNCRDNLCWCCIDGKVVQIPAEQCKEKGGRCFRTKDEAAKNCRPPVGKVCCVEGEYKGVSKDDPKCKGGKTSRFVLVIKQPNCGKKFSGRIIDPDTGAARSSITGTITPAGRGCCRLEGKSKGLPGSGDEGCVHKVSATLCLKDGKWVVTNGTYTIITGRCCSGGTFKMKQM